MLLLCMSCLTCPSLCNDRADGPDNSELPGGAAGAVPAWLWTSLRLCGDVREVPQILAWTRPSSSKEGRFRRILRHFSHSVQLDVSAHFSALDGQQLLVVEGSGVAGMPGA